MPTKPLHLRTDGRVLPEDSTDLEDLLSSRDRTKSSDGTYEVSEKILPHPYTHRYQSNDEPRCFVGFLTGLWAHCALFFVHRPCCGWICTMALIASVAFGLAFLVDPTKEVGVITYDWTNVESEMDLKIGNIDHWCIGVSFCGYRLIGR